MKLNLVCSETEGGALYIYIYIYRERERGEREREERENAKSDGSHGLFK